MNKLLIFAIRLYQKFISPLTPNSCRYYPTCSEYSLQAISKYGFFKGGFKSIRRILSCHPFGKGGHDPLI